MKILPFLSLALASLTLPSCVALPVAGASYVGVTQTAPDDLAPADTVDQIQQHDSWCYESMGYAECYDRAQNTDPNRLINVDPPNQYPMNGQAYRNAVQQGASSP